MENVKTEAPADVAKSLVDLQATLTVMIVLTMAGGFVLKYFWLWFIVPLGVAPIGFPHAIGLSIFFKVFAAGSPSGTKIGNGKLLGMGLAFLALLFGIGYLCHYLM